MSQRIQGTLVALVLLALGGAAAGQEAPAGKAGAWDSTEGPPSWIDAAAPGKDVVRGVVASQSNLLELAETYDARWLSRSVLSSIAWRLRPVLGEGADAVLDLALPAPPTTRRAYHATPARRGDRHPGAGHYTVWILWEIPIATVLAKVPEAQRDAARTSLAAGEPEGTPPWTEVPAAPEWAAAAPTAGEAWAVTVEVLSDRADVARAEAVALSEERVAWSIAKPLKALLGAEAAWDVGRRAATWRRATHRGFSTTGERKQAWARFEVPMARLLGAVSEEKRDAARKALLGIAPR